MSNVFSSAIFCARNTNKAESGDYGRIPVAIGQAKNVMNSIMTLDNTIGKGAKTAVDAFHQVCKSEPILEYIGKGVDLASKHVNSLICISAGLKVYNSDDKLSAAVQQTSALVSMFTVESLMKKYLDEIPKIKGIDKIAQKVLQFSAKTPGAKPIPAIIKGVTFVIGSTAGFMAGEKFGKLLTAGREAKQAEETEQNKQNNQSEQTKKA